MDSRDLIPFMRSVERCEQQLGELEFTWRLIESTARMICPREARSILPTMAATREGFSSLEARLVRSLAEENLKKVASGLGAKAQISVDIIVRNLYERTADVGFLATDADIVSFIQEGAPSDAIIRRLAEYRTKYTVYDDVLILSPDGRVLAHLDERQEVKQSADPIIASALGREGFVEQFGKSDLRPGVERALLYGRRILDGAGKSIGVLVLSFRFDDEMAGIFASLSQPGERATMILLDAQSVVIATSDSNHIPYGCRVTRASAEQWCVTEHAGREYLSQTRATQGYQGYCGLGWSGHAMIPLDAAFRVRGGDAELEIPEAFLSLGEVFNDDLNQVSLQASEINRSLRRVVWNGQVMATAEQGDLFRLKSVLQQISETGGRTRQLFADAMRDLTATVVSSSLQEARTVASLMIDIMDRNLYERANDCRWWALTSGIIQHLARDDFDDAGRQVIRGILGYINRLYTVYTRLFVYDVKGLVVASSDLHNDQRAFEGQWVDASVLQALKRLQGTQSYWVSPFEAHEIYHDRPTYIYHAAIRANAPGSPLVGGIGIVFDSEPEFKAMLAGALPSGGRAYFANRDGRVISAVGHDFKAGETTVIDPDFLSLSHGQQTSKVVLIEGVPTIVGGAMSGGYREYKTSGDYENDVFAVVHIPLTQSAVDLERYSREEVSATHYESKTRVVQAVEVATFRAGRMLFGIPSGSIDEAVDSRAINPIASTTPEMVGVVSITNREGARSGFVPVIDLRVLLNLGRHSDRGQVVVVNTSGGRLGLLVDDLDAVIELDQTQIAEVPEMLRDRAGWVNGMVNLGGKNGIVPVLDCEALLRVARTLSSKQPIDREPWMAMDAFLSSEQPA